MEKLDLSKFKKVSTTKEHTVFQHPDGHEIRVKHNPLSKEARDTMKSLPTVQHFDEDTEEPVAEDAAAQAPEAEQALASQDTAGLPGQIGAPQQGGFLSAALPQPQQAPTPERQPDSAPDASPKGVTPEQGYQDLSKGLQDEQKAQSELGKAQADTQGTFANSEARLNQHYQESLQNYERTIQGLNKEIDAGKINPNQLTDSMHWWGKATTAIGLILGGMGAAKDGRNPAVDYLQKEIDRDVDAQKANLGLKKSLLEANMQHYRDIGVATQVTRSMLGDILTNKLAQTQETAQDPITRAKLEQAMGQLKTQYAPALQQSLQQRAIDKALGQAQQTGGTVDFDPSQLVDSRVKEPGERAKTFEEIKKRENISKNGTDILRAFDDASKDFSGTGHVTGLLKSPRSVMALHALMLPNFKAIDGTVRQAAMDEAFKDMTPTVYDTSSDLQRKRQALEKWLTSESQDTISRGHGIPLDRFKSTKVSLPEREEIKTKNGVPHRKVKRNGQVGWVPVK
jgi:hypothetical protein